MTASARLSVEDWNRLNRLLEAGLALDVANRSGWLETLPPDSAHLQPLLAKLLAESQVTGFADDLTPPTSVVRMASDAITAMRTEQPGDRIGPWRLDRLLGEGGMGSVWLAQRADGVMQRTAALKLPRAEWVDRGLTERIARERAILARLQHPNIAVLYDAGLSADGRPFLALECVDGMPMDAFCRSADLRQVLRLFVLVARAVAYAHSRLVIHRDLKFSNVLITADGVPKLLDFGISKLIEGETPAEATALTRLAGRPLTLAYAAPEQVLGQPVTVASDVYSLGVMLFELLSGARLYTAATAHALEAEVLRGDLRRPSDAAADKARAKALRGDLDAIVQTALKRNPESRYQSATELADDLERYLDSKPVRAQADSAAYRVRKFAARNRAGVIAGAAVALALAVGLGVALWQGKEAREQAERATALNTFVLSLIQRADPNASRQSRAADRAMLAEIEGRIDAELKARPDQRLLLQVAVGDAYRNRGEIADARRVYLRAAQEARPHLPENHLPLLRVRVQAANPSMILSNAAAADLDRAIETLRKLGAKGADLLVEALLMRATLGGLYMIPEAMSPAKSLELTHEARDVAIRHLGAGSRQHLAALTRLASVEGLYGDPKQADRLFREGIEAAEARGGDVLESVEYTRMQAIVLVGRCAQGDTQARLELQRFIATTRARYGDTSIQHADALDFLSDCADIRKDPVFRRLNEDVYAIVAAIETPPSSRLMFAAHDALRVALNFNELAAAERYYQAAIENTHAIVEPDLRERLSRRVRGLHICLLTLRGEVDEARRVAAPLITAVDDDFDRTGRMSVFDNPMWGCVIRLLRDSGSVDEALKTTQKLLARCLGMKFPNPRSCSGAFAQAALAQVDAGQHREAMATMERSPGARDERCSTCPFPLAMGRTSLANGRPAEALEPLREAYADALYNGDTRSMASNEVLYWFGKAWIANGETVRGERMVAQARKALAASPLVRYRELAAQ